MNIDQRCVQAREALARSAYQEAITLLTDCVTTRPDHAPSWFLLGAALDRDGQITEAERAFRACERCDPCHPQAANALAAVLAQTGRLDEAIAAFRRALALNPGDAQIRVNLGIAHERLGKQQDALAWYGAALHSDADHLGALNNRGALLLKLERPEDALADHLRFARLAPHNPLGHYYCAETLLTLFREDEALASCDTALACDPAQVRAHFLRGVILSCLGRKTEALRSFDTAEHMDGQAFRELCTQTAVSPWTGKAALPDNLHFLRQFDRLRLGDWRRRDAFLHDLEQAVAAWSRGTDEGFPDPGLAHPSLSLPLTRQTPLRLARSIAAGIASTVPAHFRHDAPLAASADARLRIGYVSPDFRNHACAHLTRDLFALHDRSRFAIHAYALCADDGSPWRRQIAAGCDVFHDVSGESTERIDALIRQERIDILIDLAGYTAGCRPALFLARPAPINIGYLGYAGTLGTSTVDYFMTNHAASPPEQADGFAEKLIRLPGSCFPYPQDQTIAAPCSRRAYGLPDHAFVFCCFNNTWKVEPSVFDCWMRILRRVPHAVLWLYCPQPAVATNLCREAAVRGIDPARLVFAPPLPIADHLARYRVADLFLDTFHYGGHTTTLDALWAGLPVLTLPGASYASRVSLSHLSALGMPELAAADEQAYEDLACALAADSDRLAQRRARLSRLRETSPLFRTAGLVRHIEDAYLAAWQRHRAGLPPDHIDLHPHPTSRRT